MPVAPPVISATLPSKENNSFGVILALLKISQRVDLLLAMQERWFHRLKSGPIVEVKSCRSRRHWQAAVSRQVYVPLRQNLELMPPKPEIKFEMDFRWCLSSLDIVLPSLAKRIDFKFCRLFYLSKD
jgi:hypothetical protein